MIHWFKKHPEFLREESQKLASDSNYRELAQFRNNLFVSHGNILIWGNEIHKFPFVIVYTDATPYALPQIYPLNKTLSSAHIEVLSKLALHQVPAFLHEHIQFYYHLRHQNSSGALCILEWDNLDDDFKFFGITTILERVKQWCEGLLSGHFPPDNQEVEFCAHFNNISPDLKLLYPKDFLNTQFVQGFFYANRTGIIHKGVFFNNESSIYLGVVFDGVSKEGIYIDNTRNLNLTIHPALKSSTDFITQKNIVSELVAAKGLLEGYWFHLTKEPNPFASFKDLLTLIGAGNFEDGIKRFINNCGECIASLPSTLYIGIRFPNRKGDLEFQLFKVLKDDSTTLKISHDPYEQLIFKTEVYDIVEAVECEKMTPESFFARNGDRAKYDTLSNSEINIIGVGALGSEISDNIAKAGVGKINLVDNQTLKAHNAVRHLAGLESLGQSKVQATAKILKDHNPFTTVYPTPINISFGDLCLYTFSNTLSVSSIADDNTEGFLNEQAVIYNREVFYARALRGGKVGRIFRVTPGKDACMHCLDLYRKDKDTFIDIPSDPQYPTIKNECNNPVRPASAADLKLIAALCSRLVIEHLQDGPSKSNHWIWTTEAIEGTAIDKPYQVIDQFIPPHPDCYYCNLDKKYSVELKKDRLEFMQSLVSQDPTIETGGVLAGYVDDDMKIVITEVSGPGPNAKRSATYFEKDNAFCQEFLDKLYRTYGEKAVYVGEWHSHPSKNNSPSNTDIKSLTEISFQKEYLTDKPVMIILSNMGSPACTIHPTSKRFYTTDIAVT